MRACPRCGATYEEDASFCVADGTRLEEAPVHPAGCSPGSVLGSYRLLDLLGEGGMGRVYLAEHTRLGRRVALKMLRPEVAAHPQAVRRFFAEARAVNRLVHENVVQITDFFEGEGPDEPRFYIMELLVGQSLRQLLEREGAQRPERVVRIGRQLASALAAVHEAGIVHRDLKPDNVFLIERSGERDFVKLLDFGIARHLQPEAGDPRTALGAVLGTPEYMAPEQAAGAAGVDGRSDVYALGVILYELVTGLQPIRGATFTETMARQVTFVPPPPSEQLQRAIPAELEELIVACLEKEPERRPRSMREVEARLAAIAPPRPQQLAGGTLLDVGGTGAPPPPVHATEPSSLAAPAELAVAPPEIEEQPQRSRASIVTVLLLLVAAAAGGGAWLFLGGTDRPEATAPTADAAPAPAPVPTTRPTEPADDTRRTAPARGAQKAPPPKPARATPPAPR